MLARESINNSTGSKISSSFGFRYEKYPEDSAVDMYGVPGSDPWGKDFPDFEYTSI